MLGALPFGVIYGALAVHAGLSVFAAMGMSLFVFAGSSQFVAVGLLSAGAPLLLIVGVTIIVNLRHMLYSAALLPHLRRLPIGVRAILAFWLTDETFAVSAAHFASAAGAAPAVVNPAATGGAAAAAAAPIDPSANPDAETVDRSHRHWFQIGSSVGMYINWQFWTLIGVVLGTRVASIGSWGLDLAMPVTFIGMVIPYVRNKAMVACVSASGATALLTLSLPYHLGLVLAAVAGILAGTIFSRAARRGNAAA